MWISLPHSNIVITINTSKTALKRPACWLAIQRHFTGHVQIQLETFLNKCRCAAMMSYHKSPPQRYLVYFAYSIGSKYKIKEAHVSLSAGAVCIFYTVIYICQSRFAPFWSSYSVTSEFSENAHARPCKSAWLFTQRARHRAAHLSHLAPGQGRFYAQVN